MWSVFFVFLSYLDRNFVKADFLSRALDVEKQGKEMFSMLNDTFCAKMSTLGENFLYQVSDGTEVVSSVVSPAGKLVSCSVRMDQMVVKSFVHECRLGLKGQRPRRQVGTRFARMDEAKTMCREFKEKSARGGVVNTADAEDWTSQRELLKRSKRGFTYPGTLWCGLGNLADDYDQLGDFAETDSCCRTHDHCPDVIHPWSSNYGQTNLKWHSICHCDCDNALKNCLRKVNDTSSRVVGQAFFNVIGAPCFEFVYEEQCAERHWYGLCKRYEKFPVAVLKEAVPYDFGGIDVIDELTVAPPKKKDSKISQEEEKQESTPPSTMSGPEEPSLTNVVTAAEDFIKVLATVSTSQSSTADSDRGDTQSSEKKKRKNGGKKKKKTGKKPKGKEKGRKRKQKSEASVRMEDGAAVSPSGSKADKVVALGNFINKSHRRDPSGGNRDGNGDGEYELGRRTRPPNEVMKDEPAAVKERVSVASKVRKRPADSDSEVLPSGSPDRERRLKKVRGKKKKIQDTNTADNSRVVHTPPTTTTQAEQPSSERPPVRSAVRIPTLNQNRSEDNSEAGRRRRKFILVPPDRDTTPPAVPSVSTAEGRLSHRPEGYGGKPIQLHTAPNSSFSALKRQRAKERRERSRRRKTALPFSSENPPFHSGRERMLPVTPRVAPHGPTDAAAEAPGERRLSASAAPSARQQGKAGVNTEVAAAPTRPEPPPLPSATDQLGLHTTSTAAPATGPIQFSSEGAKARLTRKKKKKKAAPSVRQQ